MNFHDYLSTKIHSRQLAALQIKRLFSIGLK